MSNKYTSIPQKVLTKKNFLNTKHFNEPSVPATLTSIAHVNCYYIKQQDYATMHQYIYIYIHILYSSVNIKNMFERRSTFFIITIITGDEGRRRRSET